MGLAGNVRGRVATFRERREAGWLLRRCAAVGHVVACVEDPGLAARLQATSSAGTALLRCLRCGDFVDLSGPSRVHHVGAGQTLPLSEVPLIVRGTHGRRVALLRVLAAERFARGLVLAFAAAGAFSLGNHAPEVLAWLHRTSQTLAKVSVDLGIDVSGKSLLHSIERLLSMSNGAYNAVGAALLVYGVVQMLEGVGLWGAKRWGEYLAASATTLFIPLEVYEINSHPTTLKWLALSINIVVVVYLVLRGRLFGVRGGHDGYLVEVRDATLLADELRALGRDPAEHSSHFIG